MAVTDEKAQEFARLLAHYQDETRPSYERTEAWDLIADFAVENADAILSALVTKPTPGERLECDVRLPGVTLRRGVSLDTFLLAMRRRKEWADEERSLPAAPFPTPPAAAKED